MKLLLLLMMIFALMNASKVCASDFTWVNRVSFLSEYYSRGISQTEERPAPQYETTLFHSSGLFAGIFVSRVEFLDGDQADQELDYYLAYQETNGNWYHRVGAIYFTYPNSDENLNYNFLEFDAGIGYNFGPVYTEASFRFSPNHFGDSGKEIYSKLVTHIPIREDLKMKNHLAYRSVEKNEVFFNIPDSFDWELGLEYQTPIDGTALLLKYVDSTFGRNECFNTDYCNERLIFGITHTF